MTVENAALGRPAEQSGLYHLGEYLHGIANKSVDGNTNPFPNGLSCSYADTQHGGYYPNGGPAWWQVDLGGEYDVVKIEIHTPANVADRGELYICKEFPCAFYHCLMFYKNISPLKCQIS